MVVFVFIRFVFSVSIFSYIGGWSCRNGIFGSDVDSLDKIILSVRNSI